MQPQPPSQPSLARGQEQGHLDGTTYPQILDKIMSFASNETLMRLRFVSHYFKARADGLLSEHVLFRPSNRGHSRWDAEDCHGPCKGKLHLRNMFYSTTGARLPAFYSLPQGYDSAECSATIARLLSSVRVFDCVGHRQVCLDYNLSEDNAATRVWKAKLKPAIVRTFADDSFETTADAPTHVHLMPRTTLPTDLYIAISLEATKFVLCLPGNIVNIVPRHPSLDVRRNTRGKRNRKIEEVVFIFRSDDTSRPAQNDKDNRQRENEGEAEDSNQADTQATTCANILGMLFGFMYSLALKNHKKVTNITVVDFPFSFSRAERCVPGVFRTIFGHTRFVDAETYRKRVGETTWAFETDSSMFEWRRAR